MSSDVALDQDYEPLHSGTGFDGADGESIVARPILIVPEDTESPFSWLEYSVFVMLGIAMLWAW